MKNQDAIIKTVAIIGAIGFFISLGLVFWAMFSTVSISQDYFVNGLHTTATFSFIVLLYQVMMYSPIGIAIFGAMFFFGMALWGKIP